MLEAKDAKDAKIQLAHVLCVLSSPRIAGTMMAATQLRDVYLKLKGSISLNGRIWQVHAENVRMQMDAVKVAIDP